MVWAKIVLGLVNLFNFVASWLRIEQAKADGAAIEAGRNAQAGLEASEAMAKAQASTEVPDAAETALEQGMFLISPGLAAPSDLLESVSAMTERRPRKRTPKPKRRK